LQLEVVVCLPREAETVALVRTVITNTLHLFGVAEECVEDIRLAVSEACTNVVSHAAGDDEYEVEVHVDDDVCAINVRDKGTGFDSSALTGLLPDPMSAGGRGAAIMHAVMDTVNFTSSPEQGTIVHLVRALTARPDGPLARLRSQSV